MTLEIWEIASDGLLKTLGQNNFKSWIEPLQFINNSDGTAQFSVPTSFFGNYVFQHFGEQILHQVRESGLHVQRISFSVGRADRASFGAQKLPAESKPFKAREIQGAKLDPRFLFDNFVVGKPNELAHAAAKQIGRASCRERV